MNMSPKQIVAELDRYIIGQHNAKRAVAVALRNRYRRSKLNDEQREEFTPKNIIMKGPTGVGKTEIARRLAKLVRAPFTKVEATKFTEVGYVGRDVESMIRDLAEVAVRLVRDEKFKEVEKKAKDIAERKVAEAIYNERKRQNSDEPVLKDQILADVKAGKLNKTIVEIAIIDKPKTMEILPGMGAAIDLGELMGGIMQTKRRKNRKLAVEDAIKIITEEESEAMIDIESINAEAIRRAEQEGIIFIDEIDKIAGNGNTTGPDVSREGVQRDILPIVEGSTVNTKYGAIRTDYILFIASGAFHISKVEDLIPELQGRFPIRVELDNLGKKEFIDILTKPDNAITKQYTELLKVDNINLKFKPDAIEEIAEIAALENETSENIGARRLHTILEYLLEDISFNASGDHPMIDVVIDKKYVHEHLKTTIKKHDLKKYIL
ncbi:MAG TPA: ATP-dependent protease ATPase subunit HslU [Clostridiales bacterium]|nr:ATP-dependent protease ATPase subunit HslU [Clostridiales bacterium]